MKQSTLLAACLICFSTSLFADIRVIDNSADTVRQRMEVPGSPQVSVQQVAAVAPVSAGSGEGLGLSGEAIYQKFCVACHAAGVAGAPKLGDKAAWAPRLEQDMEALVTHMVKGLNAMPPKGTCMQCTEGDLKKALEFITDSL